MSEGYGEHTEESLFGGAMVCRQPGNGYRYSVDSVLLGHFISPGTTDTILDLGAGCGIVSLILAYRFPGIRLFSLELQSELARLCRENIKANRLEGRVVAIEGDLRCIEKHCAAGSLSWVVSNPPFWRTSSGRVSMTEQEALARHEISADLLSVARAAAYVLKKKGRAAFVYPAARLTSLFTCLRTAGLEPRRIQAVHAHPGSTAKIVLVEAIKDGGEDARILPPFYIHQTAGGGYTPEMAACYQWGCTQKKSTTID